MTIEINTQGGGWVGGCLSAGERKMVYFFDFYNKILG